MEEPLSTIPPTTLEAQVLDRLRSAILKGEFELGGQLNQAKVARMLGTSRGPVRAALNKLEEEGLVRNIPHRGTYVTPLDRKTVSNLYGVRAVLEGYAVRTSIPLCGEEDIKFISSMVEQMQVAASEEKTDEVIQFDLQVHEFFVRRTENLLLMQIWSTLKTHVLRALSFRHYSYPDLQEIAASHLELIEYMRSGEADEAAEFIEAHIHDAGEDLLDRWTLNS